MVARYEMLTLLPKGFAEAAGFSSELVTRELTLALAPVHVQMVWHLRRDTDLVRRWLREWMPAAVA